MEQLLQRYIRGKASEEERLKVALWSDGNPENTCGFLALHKLYDLSLWQGDTNEKYSVKKRHSSIRKITIKLLKITAIFLVSFWGSKQLLTQQPDRAQMRTIHVPTEWRAEVVLADGIHVWLSSRSTLKFSEQFSVNTRNVELDGEGYFSVQHDEKNPFTVQTPKYTVQILGTEFNIKTYHDSPLFETALIKGSAGIASPELSQSLRLKLDETVVVSNGRLETSYISDCNYFKWKEGLFCFKNESVQDLIDKL